METKEAYKKITSDKNLMDQFVENPTKILRDLGVDLEKTKITEVNKKEISKDGLLKGCLSVGELVCYSFD